MHLLLWERKDCSTLRSVIWSPRIFAMCEGTGCRGTGNESSYTFFSFAVGPFPAFLPLGVSPLARGFLTP